METLQKKNAYNCYMSASFEEVQKITKPKLVNLISLIAQEHGEMVNKS